jgi:hypothetical protein
VAEVVLLLPPLLEQLDSRPTPMSAAASTAMIDFLLRMRELLVISTPRTAEVTRDPRAWLLGDQSAQRVRLHGHASRTSPTTQARSPHRVTRPPLACMDLSTTVIENPILARDPVPDKDSVVKTR